jgi:hypothetical protein
VTGNGQGSFFAIDVNGRHIWIKPMTRVVIVKFSSFPISTHVESAGLAISKMDAVARLESGRSGPTSARSAPRFEP